MMASKKRKSEGDDVGSPLKKAKIDEAKGAEVKLPAAFKPGDIEAVISSSSDRAELEALGNSLTKLAEDAKKAHWSVKGVTFIKNEFASIFGRDWYIKRSDKKSIDALMSRFDVSRAGVSLKVDGPVYEKDEYDDLVKIETDYSFSIPFEVPGSGKKLIKISSKIKENKSDKYEDAPEPEQVFKIVDDAGTAVVDFLGSLGARQKTLQTGLSELGVDAKDMGDFMTVLLAIVDAVESTNTNDSKCIGELFRGEDTNNQFNLLDDSDKELVWDKEKELVELRDV